MKRLWPVLTVIMIVALSVIGVQSRAQAPDNTPIKPEIPLADRNNPDRVFLEHADQLRSTFNTDYQILVGNVEFRRDGMFMYCDSAHFYDKTGSFDAFGNVRMEQGDTLFVYADTLNYSDPDRRAILIAAPMKKVKLINRDVTLITDEFNYDLEADLGYYEVGGQLTDKQNKLTSREGEYSPTTKEAVFRYAVHLTSLSDKDTLEIFTDNLYYNTLTHVAEMTSLSRVINGDGVIVTTNGVYNTETTQAELYDRSTVEAKNGNTITGDTLFYNRQTGRGEAFGNMEINDTTNHVILQGDYGYYDEMIDSAFVTGRARAIEFSTADTLFLHGDTIRAFRVINITSRPVAPVAISAPVDSLPADSLSTLNLPTDSLLTVNMPTDSLPTDSLVINTLLQNSLMTEPVLPDSISPTATLPDSIDIDPLVTDSLKPITLPDNFPKAEIKPEMIEIADTVRYLIASPRVKFYRRDMQGLCDSMTFVSTDTMLYMDRHPIVWSENRQITGDAIQIHLNDSTVEWAHIPQGGFMADELEEGIYNQLSGKEMHATFLNGALHRLDVSGNVLAISFPEENDSTINKVMNIESSFLVAFFKENTIDSMKLWSETTASVTPLYLAKKSIFFLPSFKWFDIFRPTSPDDIFNFPPELVDLLDNAPVYRPAQSAAAKASRESSPSAMTAPQKPEAIEPEDQSDQEIKPEDSDEPQIGTESETEIGSNDNETIELHESQDNDSERSSDEESSDQRPEDISRQ